MKKFLYSSKCPGYRAIYFINVSKEFIRFTVAQDVCKYTLKY